MMDGLRLSALALHAVADRDRAWLLSRLPAVHRRQLSSLLRELRGTGIPADQELLNQLVLEKEALASNPMPDAPAATVLRAQAQDIWALLRGEPDMLVARIVRLNDWPWKAAFLELCGAGRAKRVEELSARQASAAALDKALIEELEQRLAVRQSSAVRMQPARWQFLRRGRSLT